MRTGEFFGNKITRLIAGDNPFGGHSYIDPIVTGKEMKEHCYETKKLYNLYFELEETGFDCMFPLADPVYVQVLKEYKRDGGKMKFIFQSDSAMMDFPMAKQLEALEPIGIYVSGTKTDVRYERGDIAGIKQAIADCREALGSNVKIGIGSHYPNILEEADRDGWDVDFYVGCLHNIRRNRVGEESGFITGKSKRGVQFFQNDRPIMLNTLANLEKPCIAFKIFAGGNLLLSEDQNEVRETIKNCYREVYTKIKPNDIAAIGVFNKYKNQMKEDMELYNEVMDELEGK